LTKPQLYGIKADEILFVNLEGVDSPIGASDLIGGAWRMQLLIVIAQDEDADLLSQRLGAVNLRATKIDTVGGFLARGNITLLIGVEDDRVEDVFDAIRATCHTRRRFVNPLMSTADGLSLTVPGPILPMEVEIGGAIVFSLPVKRHVLTHGGGPQPVASRDGDAVETKEFAAPGADEIAGANAMSLVLSIVRYEDADKVVGGLLAGGHRVTRINTAGVFLRRRNVTLLVGVRQDKVDEVLTIIQTNCRRREGATPASEGMPSYSATTFVLDVARLDRI
jgi:uncharacterized protein YaaQ